MPSPAPDAFATRRALGIASILVSNILVLFALLPITDVAICETESIGDRAVSLLDISRAGVKSIIVAYWLLVGFMAVGFVRLATHVTFFHIEAQHLFMTVIDIVLGLTSCGFVVVCFIIVVNWVVQEPRCTFDRAASPFLGLVMTGSLVALMTTAFDVGMLIFDNRQMDELELIPQQDPDASACSTKHNTVELNRVEVTEAVTNDTHVSVSSPEAHEDQTSVDEASEGAI